MAGRTSGLLAFLTKAGPRSAPSGWALALDAAIAVGTAAGAVAEVAVHTVQSVFITPEGTFVRHTVIVHASAAMIAAALLATLPLAARRLYPVTVWLVIAAATLTMGDQAPSVVFGKWSSPPTARWCTAGTGTWPSPSCSPSRWA